jgi:hypothetical protein
VQVFCVYFFSGTDAKLAYCSTKAEARNTRESFVQLSYNFEFAPWNYGCPMPCQRTKYLSTLQYYHNTSWTSV